jgi:putative ABC transport system substrate-binding protein
MKRRDFIALLSGAAVAWPFSARSQQPATPVVGFLNIASPGPFSHVVVAFRQGLYDEGFADGKNVKIEYRWAENQLERLPALAAELAVDQVAVIIAGGTNAPGLAAKAVTTTIPIVFVSGADPLKSGLIASLNRPGSNITGVSLITSMLGVKRFELLRELVPGAIVIAFLVNPNDPNTESDITDIEEAAKIVGQRVIIVKAGAEHEFEAAFASVKQQAAALLVQADTFFNNNRTQLAALAARYAIPAIYSLREYPVAGGLISYGTSITSAYRQAGIYAGKILKGAKPFDLPVVQPTRFELVINLSAAKALGLTLPPSLLAHADEVIE